MTSAFKAIVTVGLAMLVGQQSAVAAPILSYDIASATNPSSVGVGLIASGMTASAITFAPALTRPAFWSGTTGLFGATGYPVSSTRTSNAFLQFSVSAAPGKQISFDSLTYGLVREIRLTGSSLTGPAQWDLMYSLDSFATAGTLLDTLTVPDSGASNTLSQKTFTTDISAIGTQVGSVTFRLFGYGSAANTDFYLGGLGNGTGGGIGQSGDRRWAGTGSNVLLAGTVSDIATPKVPEPSTMLLVVLSASICLGVTGAGRRERQTG